MAKSPRAVIAIMMVSLAFVATTSADAHKLRQANVPIVVGDSDVWVTPQSDWNRLDVRSGKYNETWTLDGQQLNDVTFFGGIPFGQPLQKERSKKREPLPKFTGETLLVEIPELLEGTYRANGRLKNFELKNSEPAKFMGRDGIFFEFEYADDDDLIRRGQAFAAIIDKKLYMMSFEAPRLHYFAKNLSDFRQLAESAVLK